MFLSANDYLSEVSFNFNTNVSIICTYDNMIVAPTITDAPDDLTVVQPEDATFTCVATARPRPNITWWRVESDGNLTQVVEEANVTSITEMMSGERVLMSNLTIEETEACDAGNYTCVAENEVDLYNATAYLGIIGKFTVKCLHC